MDKRRSVLPFYSGRTLNAMAADRNRQHMAVEHLSSHCAISLRIDQEETAANRAMVKDSWDKELVTP